jgi:predicted nucleic acid-binding protein
MEKKAIKIKKSAKIIVNRIYHGEEVGITSIQVAEIANIVERYLDHAKALDIEEFLILSPNIIVFDADRSGLVGSIEIARRYEDNKIGLSDCFAYRVMLEQGITEIYSFDKHFDNLETIQRITN